MKVAKRNNLTLLGVNVRIAVIDPTFCKPRRCNLECIRFCPLVRAGSEAIRLVEELGRPVIIENVCTGCGICVKKCPFKAIKIVNLPQELEEEAVHRYGPNAFKLFRLPIPKKGKVLGIIGRNGVGKTTALKILSGRIRPNLGKFDKQVTWEEIIKFFRGSELQPYFEALSKGYFKPVYKPQAVDNIPKLIRGKVKDLLERADELGKIDEVKTSLGLEKIWERDLKLLSGGELQKVAMAVIMLKDADIYLIDEPSSYLDVKERLKVAKLIRKLTREDAYVVVVEHDLAVLDYISDYVSIIYGEPGVYGIVSLPRGVRNGINAYLQGYLREENIKIRDKPVKFHLKPLPTEWKPEEVSLSWSKIVKKFDGFTLVAEGGEVHRGEVIGILGPNGIGKSTFIKILAGLIKPDEGYVSLSKELKVSYKPQYLSKIEYYGTVRDYLEEDGIKVSESRVKSEILRPLGLERLMDRYLPELSGGELQRVIIAACLLRDADIYLLDEPMAYLDIEQRLTVAKLIRRMTEEREATTFVVEHDVVMQDFISTSIMVFTGDPGVRGFAYRPEGLRKGMNRFLREVGVTFRRDLETGRPRINKEDSWLDRYQKEVLKEYYYVPSREER